MFSAIFWILALGGGYLMMRGKKATTTPQTEPASSSSAAAETAPVQVPQKVQEAMDKVRELLGELSGVKPENLKIDVRTSDNYATVSDKRTGSAIIKGDLFKVASYLESGKLWVDPSSEQYGKPFSGQAITVP